MLLIDNPTVLSVLSMEECINVQEQAFLGLPTGASIHRPRIDMYVPCDRDDGYWRWGTMEGASKDLGVFAIRMKSDVALLPTCAPGQLPWLGLSGPLRKRLAITAGQCNVHLLLGRDAGANPFNGDDEHVFDFGRCQSPIGLKLKVPCNICAGALRYSSRPHGDSGPKDGPQL